MSNEKAVVVFSGGQDSTFCLFWAATRFKHIRAITFNYGQRHAVEIAAAQRVLDYARMNYRDVVFEHEICTVGPILQGTSPLVSNNELEQYSDHHSLPGGLEKTFVPMRNQLFLTLAANRAFVFGTNNLVTGVCQEDNGGYPDCTQNFINLLSDASTAGTFTEEAGFPDGLHIHTPLMFLTKAQTVLESTRYPFCYQATAFSHTAYDGQYPPTGHDHATLLRAKGFEEADTPDPLILRAYLEGLMSLPDAPNYQAGQALEDYLIAVSQAMAAVEHLEKVGAE